MAIRKILVLLLCLLNCSKLSWGFLRPSLPPFYENACTEDTERDNNQKYYCSNGYCGNYQPIISRTITCSNILVYDLNLYTEPKERVPQMYPLTLIVTNSEIPELPPATFKNLKNLTVLYMENIKLKTIMPAAFNYLDQIKEIYLGQNELTTVSDGIFNTLIMLEKLDLSRNQIETVTNHAFVGVSLKNLDLNHNNISGLENVLIHSLKHLSALDMSYNNLSNITSLYRLSVQNLNLSHNNIDVVDFEMLQEATFIDFSYNNITKILHFNTSSANSIILSHNGLNDFERNDNVNVLDIGYNNIKIISSDLLSISLKEFYVSFNFISSFKADTFFGLYSLTHLYLDNNNLSSVPNACFKDLNSLTHLNLSGNKLTYFKFGTFDNLVSLQVLDISKNDFKELPQFHSLSQLTHLFIQNNEISNIDPDVIFQQLPNLITINLNNNTWSCQKLANIVQRLKRWRNIYIPNGNFLEESNIYGIKCYETFKNSNVSILKDGINLDNSKLNSFFNEDFTKTLLYKYFNQDFKETEFFKYLEGLKISMNASHTQDIDYTTLNKILHEVASNSNGTKDGSKNSEMYDYLNADFKNTSFFKYLEHFRLDVNKSEKFDDGKIEEIVSLLKNIAGELKSISSINKSNEYLGKTDMYNYLNKDFKTSNFYRYLENLNTRNVKGIHLDDISDSTIEKLSNPHEKITDIPNYTGLLSVIAVSLLIIICIMTAIAYRQFFPLNKYNLKKEEVELI